MNKTKTQWWVPIKYHAKQTRRELSGIFSPAAIGRIILATLAILAMAFRLTHKWLPEIEFDLVSGFVKCIGVIVIFPATGSAMSIIPPLVRITPKRVLITYGQRSTLYPFNKLAELRIEESNKGFPMFIFRLRSRQEALQHPISPKLNLDVVRELIDTYWHR